MTALNFISTIPLSNDPNGTIRVGSTRVTLDAVILAFNNGATAEEIAFQFPVLRLSDIYATIGYYLSNQDEINEYLQKTTLAAEVLKKEMQQQFPIADVRKRLMDRQDSRPNPNQ